MKFAAAVVMGVLGLAASASMAQLRTLQFDVNNLQFQARDGAGAPAPFGGLSHTGSLAMSASIPTTELAAIAIRTGSGGFVNQPGAPWNLTAAVLNISMTSGMVTGGNFSIDLNGGSGGGGDTFTANIGNVGAVSTFVGGGFIVEGLLQGGMFSDTMFGTVDVSDFVAAQGSGGLPGSFISFRINPDPNGAGFADADLFVTNIPSPGSVACLGAAAGMFALRRRKR